MRIVTKEEVVEYINGNYNEDDVHSSVSEAITDYLDEDWEDEFEDEQSAYDEQGRGEAEDQVKREMYEDIFTHFYSEDGYNKDRSVEDNQVYFDRYRQQTGEEVWETIHGVFDFLDK